MIRQMSLASTKVYGYQPPPDQKGGAKLEGLPTGDLVSLSTRQRDHIKRRFMTMQKRVDVKRKLYSTV